MNLSDRRLRQVPVESWPIADSLVDRRERLHSPADPISLLQMVKAEADSAAADQFIRLCWQPSIEFPGYFRVTAMVPIKAATFDQLFNGRSGYRAQYYLSPEEGVLYNRDLVSALAPALEQSYAYAQLNAEWSLVRQSLAGPHSKLWIFEEKIAFDNAKSEVLNPPRWVSNGAITGRKAPLPDNCAIDVKGAFIHPATLELQVDELKTDRACDLFRRGYT